MPLQIKWSKFSKENVQSENDNYGVYEIGNDSGVLYIGEGQVLSSLLRHFPQSAEPIVAASYYRVEYTGGKARSVQRKNAELEDYKKAHGNYPRFNQRKG